MTHANTCCTLDLCLGTEWHLCGACVCARSCEMGWRSWNAFHSKVDQALIQGQVDALVARNSSRGDGRSLLDHGFLSVGLDDNWQNCGQGVNGSFHAPDGTPLINQATFPDMTGR